MTAPQLILGVTRRQDDPKGPVSGLIVREGEKLRWLALDALGADARFFRLTLAGGVPTPQALERVEFTHGGTPHFLFKAKDGKLAHETLAEKLQFSEANKALLKPQKLARPLPLATLALEYLEISRLSDAMRQEMLAGERSLGQLGEVLGVSAADKGLEEVLWDLSRRHWLTLHELGKPEENAIGLNKPLPAFK